LVAAKFETSNGCVSIPIKISVVAGGAVLKDRLSTSQVMITLNVLVIIYVGKSVKCADKVISYVPTLIGSVGAAIN